MVRFPIGPGRRHLLVLIAGIAVLPGYDSALRYPTLLRIHGGANGMYGGILTANFGHDQYQLSNEQDRNVPIQNSEELYQALRRRGIETQLVVYPGQPHGLRVPSYQKDRLERYLAW